MEQQLFQDIEPHDPLEGAPSFIQIVADGQTTRVDGWCVAPTGDWDHDEAMGERLADAAVRFARAQGNSAFLMFVISSIHRKISKLDSMPSGIEHGFGKRIAQLAYSGSFN